MGTTGIGADGVGRAGVGPAGAVRSAGPGAMRGSPVGVPVRGAGIAGALPVRGAGIAGAVPYVQADVAMRDCGAVYVVRTAESSAV
ncbi:hypothetical protein LQ327_08685 [Actinomycetospora endophytica]|uniref:Uncharacterized protein n=1 Tax=Actinomycetospora endophytica TaxID=2291215 RepID=A0ABS8P5C7_9PSEU|nr:hypothetical protein [Actinomycetospora endophytica]MCD2193458.1 hypothetical protein [Actinomycetospora endophytica]